MWDSKMSDDTDKTEAPDQPAKPFIPGPESGLRNPESSIERGLKEAADVMHGADAKPHRNKPDQE
jgi:hypothetical protein